jgi:hypothetical protein
MSTGNRVKSHESGVSLSHSGGNAPQENTSFQQLPPAIQRIAAQQWQALKKDLEKEELLLALEGFSRHIGKALIASPPEPALSHEQNWEKIMRGLLKRLGIVQVFEESDEEVRYRLNLLREFFEKAVVELSLLQRQAIVLAASAGRVARLMNFASVKAFQRKAFQAVAKSLYVLLNMELEQPNLEARRKAVIVEWRDLFVKKAAAFISLGV